MRRAFWGIFALLLASPVVGMSAAERLLLLQGSEIIKGSIQGSFSIPAAGSANNLTTQGSADWAAWGYSASLTPSDRKITGGSQISILTLIGPFVQTFGNATFTQSWTDGTPTGAATAEANGIYVTGQNNGFSFTVPAGIISHTIYVSIGLYQSQGKIVASLSDSSSPNYTDTSFSNLSTGQGGLYAITYNAKSNGQILTVVWTQYVSTGNVTIQAAALK